MDCKLRTGTFLQDGWSSVLLTEWYVIIGHPDNHMRLNLKMKVTRPLLRVHLLLRKSDCSHKTEFCNFLSQSYGPAQPIVIRE